MKRIAIIVIITATILIAAGIVATIKSIEELQDNIDMMNEQICYIEGVIA